MTDEETILAIATGICLVRHQEPWGTASDFARGKMLAEAHAVVGQLSTNGLMIVPRFWNKDDPNA
jgi:hypothetical protein